MHVAPGTGENSVNPEFGFGYLFFFLRFIFLILLAYS